MSVSFTNIISITAIVIWIAVFLELKKSSKEKNGRKIITLISIGVILTLVMTVSLIRNIQT
ncbi:hypothetical protein [Bacillus inaquosorum]|uniref:hypothetical protein n=1 Tax=Bacillus inaquosorum TaxID=483913 RepID=UPI00227E99B4|nr:hypothetical protein [Bacillus inaquosorum]MCY7749223.1 hypothetical protein [Bacillus inaquosorum]MCY7910155.1 hypothetical protein [Bacillus inaquosorum]MCY8183148.1 hypothetical protein [Bacillus inaquosorum]MCY8502870.1 hypothetical protein [Bacillus inaquosorum]MCY8862762.1 hypothetical protein [Bacillus inaquosorum]